jgi:hypothetical protein
MTQVVRKIRWFWDDADHAIERWLESMARQGLHLRRIRCLRTLFIFERGEPAEVSYRIDFRLWRADAHYLQLFQDAGWERVDELLGWQYWRAPAGTVRVAEIFTDVESMSRKYKHLIMLFVIPIVLQLPFAVTHFRERWHKAPAMVALSLCAYAVGLYCVLRLLKRLRSLRQPGQ